MWINLATRSRQVAFPRSFQIQVLYSTFAAPDVSTGTVNADKVRADGGTKRFYKKVDITRSAHGQDFSVKLDGRIVLTPGRSPLRLPSEGLALAIGAEWDSQKERIKPFTMPLTALANQTIDQTPHRRSELIDNVLRYLDTDTVCVRAPGPASLVEKQSAVWNPLIQWFTSHFAAPLHISTGLLVQDHPPSSLGRVRSVVDGLDDWTLTGIESMVKAAKSMVIAMALYKHALSIQSAIDAARLDEEHQAAEWGVVEGGHDVDRSDLRVRLAAASVFVDLANM